MGVQAKLPAGKKTQTRSSSPTKKLPKEWQQTVERILLAYNKISRSINPVQLLEIDLTTSQIKVLMSFAEEDGFTMTRLSNTHSVSVSTMTSMVDRLIQAGLVERRKDEDDRRIVRVLLTDAGRKTVRHLMKVRRQELAKFLDQLSGPEIDQFVTSIETVAHYLTSAKETVLPA